MWHQDGPQPRLHQLSLTFDSCVLLNEDFFKKEKPLVFLFYSTEMSCNDSKLNLCTSITHMCSVSVNSYNSPCPDFTS